MDGGDFTHVMAFLYAFLKGLGIGVSIAAPVGPIGLLCIRSTLSKGAMSGFFTGLGAAVADAFYGAVAAFGLVVIIAFLEQYRLYIGIGGAVFLFALGIRNIARKKFLEQAADGSVVILRMRSKAGLVTDFVGTLFLTLGNPATILSFIAIFAGLGLSGEQETLKAMLMVAGVFTGSALWWLFLVRVVSLLGRSIKASTMTLINRISGLVLIGFGGLALISVL